MTNDPDSPKTNVSHPSDEPARPPLVVVDWLECERDRARRRAELRPGNRQALFDVLAQAGVVQVEVDFDGFGDAGQIDGTTAYGLDSGNDLPDATVSLQQIAPDGVSVETRVVPLTEAVETFCYEALEEAHPGWEINDGAFGTFVFNVAARTIRLAHHARFTDTVDSTHDF